MPSAPHLPRSRDPWPEPEHPYLPPLPVRDRLAARFWDVMQGLELVGHVVRRAWERWRSPEPLWRRRG